MFSRGISARILLYCNTFRNKFGPKLFSSMDVYSVRYVDGDERLEISFDYALPSGKNRRFNFARNPNETLSDTLGRMRHSIGSRVDKKARKKKKLTGDEETAKPQDSVSLTLFTGDHVFEESVINKEAWLNSSTLQVNDTKYHIEINPPKVTSLKLPDCIMVGYSVLPVLDLEFSDLRKCQFKWYREADTLVQSDSNTVHNPSKKRRTSSQSKEEQYQIVSENATYIPCLKDFDKKLKLECIPSDGVRNGEPVTAQSKNVVTVGPESCPFEKRHLMTKQLSEQNSFRIVSYNILADIYADSEFSRNTLFPQCPPEILSMNYRKHLILKELAGYNADILCLQEVDRKIYLKMLLFALEEQGLEGRFCVKGGEDGESTCSEGCAIFFRKSKFRCIEEHSRNLTEVLKEDTELWERLCTSESLKETLEARNTIVQISVLENVDDPQRKVLVATTHLFFHPRANNIRLLQTFACMRHIHNTLQLYDQDETSVVFCGDLNAAPINAVHELVTTGKVKATHADWYSGGKKEFIPDMNIESPVCLQSVYGKVLYTNYVTSFHGCLDYIYIDPRKLTKVREIPLPSHDEVTEFTCLPNKVFPSDHLALVADIAWIPTSGQ